MRTISMEQGRDFWVRYKCHKKPVRTADQGRYLVLGGHPTHVCKITITADGAEFRFPHVSSVEGAKCLGF